MPRRKIEKLPVRVTGRDDLHEQGFPVPGRARKEKSPLVRYPEPFVRVLVTDEIVDIAAYVLLQGLRKDDVIPTKIGQWNVLGPVHVDGPLGAFQACAVASIRVEERG